jgi:outer membrane protein OmpA-like peptidoglycan-associated protein
VRAVVGLEAAPPAEAEVNAVIRALSPREAPPPLVLTLASTPFLSRLTVEVVRWTPVTRVRLAPGEVVAAAVPLAPVPVSIAATWPLAPQFGVVVTQTQIAVVEQSSRRVSLVIDKATRIAVGPQARFIFVQDRATLRTIVLDLGASFEQDIAFDHNSSTLSRTARQQLLAMGMALQSPSLSGARFLISGHTNAVGGDLANRELSFRRAVAVREYLSQTFGIASSRIGIHGFGPDRLKYPFDPRHPGNRRVEVALIVGGES